jgi:hypothetical protein
VIALFLDDYWVEPVQYIRAPKKEPTFEERNLSCTVADGLELVGAGNGPSTSLGDTDEILPHN